MRSRSILQPLLCALLLAAGMRATDGIAGPSKRIAKQTIKEFNRIPRGVRADHLLLPVNYVEHADQSYGYFLPRRFVRLARQGETFEIKKTKYRKKFVRLELVTTRHAKLFIKVYDRQKLSAEFLDHVLPLVLRDLFDFGAPPAGQRLVGNQRSRMVHLRGCNHLPPAADRRPFADKQAALAAGYRLCPACFSEQPAIPLEGFAPLRVQAVEHARTYELAFPPVDDPAAQAELQAVGESILEDYPIETIGFDYAFKLVHSEIPNATAMYTGFVYVTDQLMAMIEEPAELRFILAHEILHAERHRPPPPFYASGTRAEAAAQIRQYYGRLRHRETEADLIALLYMTGRQDAGLALRRARSALAKLQFVNEAVPVDQTDRFATHPSFASRLAFFDPERFTVSGVMGRVYCGRDEQGETIARIRVLGKGKETESTRIYLLVSTTDLLNEPIEIKPTRGRHVSARLRDARGKRLGLFTEELSFVMPPSTDLPLGLCVLQGEYGDHQVSSEKLYDQIDLSDVQAIELVGVEGVEDWQVCEE